MGYRRIGYDDAAALCQDVFMALGFGREQSAQITDALLAADLFGIESHGLQRLARYYLFIQKGYIRPDARPQIVSETAFSAVIEANAAMGQLAAASAMRLAIQKAKSCGVGLVAVRGSNHYGIAGYYADMAVQEDLIGICMTNSSAIMVPTYGSRPMLGSNPIAFGMPAEPVPFLFDAATSVVSRGKVEVKKKEGLSLPPGLVVDENGEACVDASRALDLIIQGLGGILPLGGTAEFSGYKGYGLGVVVEICTGILAGGVTSDKNVNAGAKWAPTSHFFGAIDYGAFGDKRQIKEHLSEYLADLRAGPRAAGCERIYTAGEKEYEAMRERRENGLLVNDKTYEELVRIARECGVQAAALQTDV